MSISKEELIEISELLYKNIEVNINQVHPVYDTSSEIHKFYYGIISRQLNFTTDISCLLSNQYVSNLTSIFLIARSILDDFLPLHYISIHSNPEEQIILLNADAHGMKYKKIRDLAKLNEDILGGSFPFYPTDASVLEMKSQILSNSDKSKYISDRSDLKFHRFLNKRQLIDTYEGKDSRADLYRCYFQRRHLSDYIHYSKFSYDFEILNQSPTNQYDLVHEIFLFAYFGCKIATSQLSNSIDLAHVEEKYFEELKVEYLSNINK